jgi:hypothetical protein
VKGRTDCRGQTYDNSSTRFNYCSYLFSRCCFCAGCVYRCTNLSHRVAVLGHAAYEGQFLATDSCDNPLHAILPEFRKYTTCQIENRRYVKDGSWIPIRALSLKLFPKITTMNPGGLQCNIHQFGGKQPKSTSLFSQEEDGVKLQS